MEGLKVEVTEVIIGRAFGADALAERWAIENGKPLLNGSATENLLDIVMRADVVIAL